MKKIYTYLVCLLLPVVAGAQPTLITIDGARAEKNNNRLSLQATLDTRDLQLDKQQMILVTPLLRAHDGSREVSFAPVLIAGKTRHKVLTRAERLDGYRLDPRPERILVLPKNSRETVDFQLEAAYETWMRQAELVFIEEVSGCRNEILGKNQYRAISRVLPPVYVPTYTVSYAEPPTEEVKQRSETFEARLNFRVNRYEIVRDYMNNAAVLDEVDKIIGEVRNDPNLTINQFHVTGYASPEGAAAGNLKLSENRAQSFVTYVQNKHAIPQSTIQVDWKGDDWDGLRRLMQESNFSSRQRVMDILDGTGDAQQRKNQLKNLGGDYRVLLDDYYPHLRRNEYTIGYIARPFSVDEAKNVVTTRPQLLSLNEMFLVANTYPKNSREFKEIFDIAVRLYPEDTYANLNSAALDIENGAYDVALERSLKVDMPEAWNNIGYIYVQKGEHAKAAEYFQRAANAGLPVAKENLAELNKWMQDPE